MKTYIVEYNPGIDTETGETIWTSKVQMKEIEASNDQEALNLAKKLFGKSLYEVYPVN